MFKYRLSRLFLYLWALFLVIGILFILMGLRGWHVLYDANQLNPSLTDMDILYISICTVFLGVLFVSICVFTRKYITKLRVKGLEEARFDEYGRLKGQDDYYELSLEAQRKMDEERKKKMNQILPVSEVKQLTKKGSSDPEKDMEQLIGLSDVKEKMEEMVAQMEFEAKHKLSNLDTANHMNMYGPPGTGKTTVARIMAAFLHKNGRIKRNEVIEIKGSSLTTPDAAIKAEAFCQHSYGGVLFIDEAYAMTNSQYGQEAIASLIKEMEDSRDKFVLILAGYENEMKMLLDSNPGFLSRIKEHFHFDSYSLEELISIFISMADKAGYQLTNDAILRVEDILDSARFDQNFGNARTCRNLLDKSITRHALNVKRGLAEGDFILSVEDIVLNNNF